MGFFDRFFTYVSKLNNEDRKPISTNGINLNNENVVKILKLKEFFNSLLENNRYIAKSDYVEIINEYKEVVEYFNVFNDSGMLENFCRTNGVKTQDIQIVLNIYYDIEYLVDRHNVKFIENSLVSEKEYLDNVLKTVDPSIVLDEDQRRVNLVIL